MKITKVRIDDIFPYEGNAKLHPTEQIAQIKESIREFGNNDPIAIDENHVIIEGHGRWLALKELGYEEAECIILKDLTEDQKKAYRIVHNQLTMNSGFDFDLLKTELENISIDMAQFDLELDNLDLEPTGEVQEVEAPEPEECEPIAKMGDIWKLGNHYLMCGDSTSEEDVRALMKAGSDHLMEADLLVTDPPYNVAVENSKGMTIENDNMGKAEFREFIGKAMKNASKSLKAGGAFYIFYGDCEDVSFRQACFGNAMPIRECLIWVKNGFTLGRQDYQWRHEPCLYGWKEGASHYFVPDRSQDTVVEDKPDLAKMSKDDLRKLAKALLGEKDEGTIIREDKPVRDADHPTMKPIKLLARLIRNSSKPLWTVLDLFGGSGSTLIACEQLNRRCRTMEYDPRYCDVIIKRWETLTGKKAKVLE